MFYWRINQIVISAFLLSMFLFGFLNKNIEAQTSDPQYDSKSNPKANRARGLDILKLIKEVVKEKYYDPSYRGINLDERFKAAEEQIKGQDKNWQIYRTIAQVLIDFNDSHTKFFPPDRLYRVEYGYSMMMIGSRCFVVTVKKGSDAEVKGLKTGDEIVAIKGFPVARENLWLINYIIYSLDPQETISLVLSGNNKQREITFQSKFISPEERKKQRQKSKADLQEKPYICQKISTETIACKLRTFGVEKEVIDKMMKEVGAHKKMILDLRGNGGGYVETETYLTGYFFEQDVKIGDEKGRTKTKLR
jgi:C-terminal processing protease CtpA/Prc